MCTFHTLLLPAATDLDAVNVLAHELLHQRFETQGHVDLERAAPDARSYVKADACDCGMELVATPARGPGPPSDRELRKLRASGWSDAKIERWLAQRTAARDRQGATHDRARTTTEARIAGWAAFVGTILDRRLAPWAGVFTHDYAGSVRTERIEIGEVRRLTGIDADRLATIVEDVPLVFTAA